MLGVITFLVGLSLAWVSIRFLLDLPRQLPKLLESFGRFLFVMAGKFAWWLLTTIFLRAYRTLQYIFSTEQVRRWRHRLETGLQDAISHFQQKLKT